MWSLPNIKRMNEQAALAYELTKGQTAKDILRGKKCDFCSKKATYYRDWYDVFGDVPKGRMFMCQAHEDHDEGYFYCDECGKTFIDNYTWELYYAHVDGEVLCLNCYLDREVFNDENWVTQPKHVTWERISKAKHLIPVEGEHWRKYLDFVGNVEFDSMTGETVVGFSSTCSRETGVNELRDLVRKAGKPCMLILDAGYQFAVSIGVYVRKQ